MSSGFERGIIPDSLEPNSLQLPLVRGRAEPAPPLTRGGWEGFEPNGLFGIITIQKNKKTEVVLGLGVFRSCGVLGISALEQVAHREHSFGHPNHLVGRTLIDGDFA